jgi:hypothetical protein
MYFEAPLDWAYAHFPLQREDDPILSLEWVVSEALVRIDRAEQTGDETHFGPVLHWAHILKAEQSPEGDWPSLVEARTGAAVGTARTRSPAALMARLDAFFDAAEYEAAIARAAARPARSNQTL